MARTVIVEGYGVSLRVKRGALVVVDSSGSRSVVPLSEVDRVVVATSGVSITSSAVRVLARSGVGLVFLDGRGSPIVSLEPPWINATAETRIAQYRAFTEMKLEYAKSIVRAKLENQARFLFFLSSFLGDDVLAREAREVERHKSRVLGVVDEKALRDVEAGAARHYWQGFARVLPDGLGFKGRKTGGSDPVNMVLNYAYSLLYAEVFRALVVHGLDPYIGFMHALRSGSPSLVFDFSEMFRVSVVDFLVYRLVGSGWKPVVDESTGLLSRETRVELLEEEAKWLKRRVIDARGQSEELWRHIMLYARRLAQSIRSMSPYEGFVEDFRV